MDKSKIIGLSVLVLVIAVIAYFFFTAGTSTTEIPPYVTGEMKMMYEWSKTSPGKELLEQIPCYCGCKFDGHMHARHCFWRDDGTFDKHGLTCSVCFDIAKKAKERHEQGIDLCTIRKEIDQFYEPNKELATETPLPAECAS